MLRRWCHAVPLCSRVLRRTCVPIQHAPRFFGHVVASDTGSQAKTVPTAADVVIIGGGIIGCSVAFHLSKMGITDVCVLEQGQVSCGTTWHAAGLVGKMRATETEIMLSNYGEHLYSTLEEEVGASTGYKRCGSITLARNGDRMQQLRRNAGRAKAFGIDARIISADEAQVRWPLMQVDDIVGALWLPEDGTANATDACMALMRGAKQYGAKFIEGTRVQAIEVEGVPRTATGVRTNMGDIKCNTVVNCGGQWARGIGRMAGVSVPLHSAEHFYIVTKAMEGVTSDMPILRDPDGWTYWREWSGGLIMGGFEPRCKPCFRGGRVPEHFEFQLLDEDWDHFEVLMEQALLRCPSLETAEIRNMVNGPESFTPDNQYILGEAPEVRKFYVAAGFNSSGIASAGGAGRALAEWIINGEPQQDLWPVDIRRFSPHHNNDDFLFDRTMETLGLHYAISWPKYELTTGRPMRVSPLYNVLRDRGAVFGSKHGWERVNYFASSPAEASVLASQYQWGKPTHFDHICNEHLHTRSSVSLFDLSSFAKLRVTGPDALHALQWLCSNDVDVPTGSIVYTGMLNARGGMETDCTIARQGEQEFFIVSPTAQAVRDANWIQRGIEERGASCALVDVSGQFSTLAIMGPRARELMQRACPNAKWENDDFPFGTFQPIDVGYAQCNAFRISYVGEQGWELYIPQEMTQQVFAHLMQCAHEIEENLLRPAGYYAIESLRVEKAFRAWGHELGPEVTPLEAGLSFACKLNDSIPFKGREALLASKRRGLKQRFVSLVCSDSDAYSYGQEPITLDGEAVGYVTSASYGHSIGAMVCLGFVRDDDPAKLKSMMKQDGFAIELNGRAVPAVLSTKPPFDPSGSRMRS